VFIFSAFVSPFLGMFHNLRHKSSESKLAFGRLASAIKGVEEGDTREEHPGRRCSDRTRAAMIYGMS